MGGRENSQENVNVFDLMRGGGDLLSFLGRQTSTFENRSHLYLGKRRGAKYSMVARGGGGGPPSIYYEEGITPFSLILRELQFFRGHNSSPKAAPRKQ